MAKEKKTKFNFKYLLFLFNSFFTLLCISTSFCSVLDHILDEQTLIIVIGPGLFLITSGRQLIWS